MNTTTATMPGTFLPAPRALTHAGSDETRLVEQLKRGSSRAFDLLVEQHAGRLYAVAFRILNNPHEAEECVQATFFKAFQSIARFRSEASLGTWLHRIVANCALTKLRRQRRSPFVAIEPFLPDFEQGHHARPVGSWGDRPDRLLQNKEFFETYQKFISELPEHYRLPYLLKEVEQLSEAEVSQILQLPVTTIRTRVHRARLAIRGRFEDHFFRPVRSRS